jgi:hypothetical protein
LLLVGPDGYVERGEQMIVRRISGGDALAAELLKMVGGKTDDQILEELGINRSDDPYGAIRAIDKYRFGS